MKEGKWIKEQINKRTTAQMKEWTNEWKHDRFNESMDD
jgi:hypothetical protein